MSPIYKLAIPFRDLLIALSFSYLYYYQGIKKKGVEPAAVGVIHKEGVIQSLNGDQLM